VLARLGVPGVAKLDFKRDDPGRLHLLEINARFNLWHDPGAVAGVNLPATVCYGRSPSPTMTPALGPWVERSSAEPAALAREHELLAVRHGAGHGVPHAGNAA
jgi:hypothetical protein